MTLVLALLSEKYGLVLAPWVVACSSEGSVRWLHRTFGSTHWPVRSVYGLQRWSVWGRDGGLHPSGGVRHVVVRLNR